MGLCREPWEGWIRVPVAGPLPMNRLPRSRNPGRSCFWNSYQDEEELVSAGLGPAAGGRAPVETAGVR